MKQWMIGSLTVAVLALGLLWLGQHPGQALAAGPDKTAPKKDSVDFWSSFKGLFLAPEPQYKDQTRSTSVTGVRGMDKEAKMTDKYDWKAVRVMEEFTVSEKQMFDFLKTGQVGPFFEKKGGGQ